MFEAATSTHRNASPPRLTERSKSRMSALMGTWTADATMKTNIGDNRVSYYAIIHFACDPLRDLQCEMDGCDPMENRVCIPVEKGGVYDDTRCGDMAEDVVISPDVAVYFYFGVNIHAGAPFHIDHISSTGGWVGPISMVLAQDTNTTSIELDPHQLAEAIDRTLAKTADTDDEQVVADRYVSRYVNSPYSPLLRMPKDCDLMGPHDFDKMLGRSALDSSISSQVTHPIGGDVDIYEDNLSTCDNGDAQPVLPQVRFTFTDGDEKADENLIVELDYRLFTYVKPGTIMETMLPSIEKKGFPVRGPYCYRNILSGWTFDLAYDSTEGSEYISLVKGCVDDLPCLPGAFETCTTCTNTTIHQKTESTIINVSGVMQLGIAVTVLSVLLLLVSYKAHKFHSEIAKIRKLEKEYLESRNHSYRLLEIEDSEGQSDGYTPSNTASAASAAAAVTTFLDEQESEAQPVTRTTSI